jgi:thiol-disulfide isomerase/thioredoxin
MNMKNRIKKLCLIVSSILVMSGSAQASGSMQSTLRGVVIDRPESDLLLLVRQGDDLRINAVRIPIIDGEFEYVFDFEHEEQYQLVFYDEQRRGSWRPIPFFLEQDVDVINFTLHPRDRFRENIIEGGKLNEMFQNYIIESHRKIGNLFNVLNAKNSRLREEGNYHTPEAQVLVNRMNENVEEEEFRALFDELRRLRFEGNYITQAARMFSDSIHHEVNLVRLRHIKENPTIVGYSALFHTVNSLSRSNRMSSETHDISPFVELYQTFFLPKFPDHSYTERMQIILGVSVTGYPFVDFTAVDLNGNPVTLSERITGKPTILNLWASWCSPCRIKGRALIPIYEEFRDKGLVVIGVARETSIANAEMAIKADGYPWENLVELNDVGQIWAKYGIGNAGGMVFLIDESGIIYASNPSIEEVREFLVGRMGEQ